MTVPTVTRPHALRRLLAAAPLVVALALLGCAETGERLPAPPAHPNGLALWNIIHDRCLPDQAERGSPAPCEAVVIDHGVGRGYVLLKDRAGPAQTLLLPAARITGIEDPRLMASDAPNYFAFAWNARGVVAAKLGRPLPDRALAVTVNSLWGRSQDQLHLHIDCLSAATVAGLARWPLATRWSPLTLGGHPYLVRRLEGPVLRVDPFHLLAGSVRGASGRMGQWTLALAGDPNGRDLLLIAGHADPAKGDAGSAEELQDHDCAAAA